MAAFSIITLAVMIGSGAWSPQTNMETFLIGLALMAWAGLGWLVSRVLGPNAGGSVSRLRDAVFALATAAALAALVALAAAARPVPETILARVTVKGQVAQIDGRSVPLVGYLFGFEYLQLDHEVKRSHAIPEFPPVRDSALLFLTSQFLVPWCLGVLYVQSVCCSRRR